MKTTLITLALLFTGLTVNADEAKEKPAEHIVLLSGNMAVGEKVVSNYWVYVFENGAPTDTFFVDARKEVFFDLDLNKNYAIKFVKEGYKERVLLIDTHVPEEGLSKSYTFRYLITFIPNGKSNTFDDFPVAHINYHEKTKDFEYNRQYHRNVRINPSEKETADL